MMVPLFASGALSVQWSSAGVGKCGVTHQCSGPVVWVKLLINPSALFLWSEHFFLPLHSTFSGFGTSWQILFLPLCSSVCVTCSVPISAAHHAPAIMAICHAKTQLELPLGDQINVPLIFERGQEKWNACFSHLIMCRIAWGRSGKTTCLFVDPNEIRGPCMDTGR